MRARTPRQAADADSNDRLSAVLAACDWDDWDERETWALEDNTRRFMVEGGKYVLWRRLGLEIPELLNRSPQELRSRWLMMQSQKGEVPEDAWGEPPCLEDWHSVGPGRYHGALHGMAGIRDGSLQVTVEHDADAAAAATMAEAVDEPKSISLQDVYGEGWCVRTKTGELFQLGLPAADAASQEDRDISSLLDPSAVGGMLKELPDLSESAAAAGKAGGLLVPPLLTGGLLLAASAIGYMVLGHHHVDVSVFIV